MAPILTIAATLARLASHAQANNQAMWYLTRAASVTAYALLIVTVDLGILRSMARELGVRVSWALDELHQFIALLAAAFVILHLITLKLDPYIAFRLRNFVLPFHQPYRPLPTDLGVLALYALAIVLISSWLRRWLDHRVWRGLHYVSFILYVLITLHGLLAGSDASQPWMRALYIGSAASVVFLIVLRVLVGPREAPAV